MIGDILQPTHLLFILVVALLVLGPKRLPEVGRSLGRGLRDFRDAMSGADRPDEVPSDTSGPIYPQPEPVSYTSEPIHQQPEAASYTSEPIHPQPEPTPPVQPDASAPASHTNGESAAAETGETEPLQGEVVSSPSPHSVAAPSEPAEPVH